MTGTEELPESIDTSNFGRCDICGKPIDLRDAGHSLITNEQMEPDHPDVDKQDAVDAVAQAIRRSGDAKDRMLADVYEGDGNFRVHGDCMEDSVLSDIFEWEDDADEQ